jgi:biopolymer transport protein ExbB/TolQ
MKNNITIHNEATIHAEGKRNSKNCKPVICIETGEVFTSATDAAEKVGVHYSMMSSVCLGKVRTCKGMHFCYMNAALENLDAVMNRLRETSAMEEDARKWRKYQAEQEEIRKAKAKHESDLKKAEDKVARRTEICEHLAAKLAQAEQRKMEAEMELEALLDNNQQEVA